MPERGETLFRGTPFCGSSGYAEAGTWRVDDIVFLRQAKYNRVQRLRGYQAYKLMVENSFVPFWDAQKSAQVLEIIVETLKAVRVWQLDCTPEPEAVEVLRDTIFGADTND